MFLPEPAQNRVYQAIVRGDAVEAARRAQHNDKDAEEALSFLVTHNDPAMVEMLIPHVTMNAVRRAAWWIGPTTEPSIVQMVVARIGSNNAPWVLANQSRKGRMEQFEVVKNAMMGEDPKSFRVAIESAIKGNHPEAFDQLAPHMDHAHCHQKFVESAIYGRLNIMGHIIPWLEHDEQFSDTAEKAVRHLSTLNTILTSSTDEDVDTLILKLCQFLSNDQIAAIHELIDQSRAYTLVGGSVEQDRKQRAKDRVSTAWASHQRMQLSQQIGEQSMISPDTEKSIKRM